MNCSEGVPGNFFLEEILAVHRTPNVFSFLTPSQLRQFGSTCFGLRVWAEVRSGMTGIPIAESDPEQALWYRLFGPYHGYSC